MSVIRIFLIAVCILLSACENTKPEWTDRQLNTIASLRLSNLGKPPPSPSNQFANDSSAALLGKEVFFDKRFSLDQKLSCASCHQPERAFTDGLALAQGIHITGRNTQGIAGAAYQTWFYWDGRKDSLWSQALVPFEAADEMASSRVQVLRIIEGDANLKQRYEEIFGRLPKRVFDKSIPANSGPWGDTITRDNWYRIPMEVRKQINVAYANVGKAIAAYERTISMPQTIFDRYAEALLNDNDAAANDFFSEEEKRGLRLFINPDKTHCLRCHNGPLFTNSDFHNIGTGNFVGEKLDFGRYFGIQAVLQDEFNCLGNYSDAELEDCHALRFSSTEVHSGMQGAYKTPGLRYLSQTGPYFHDGRFSTISDVLEHYLKKPSNNSELPQLLLTEKEKGQLLAFLETLN